jgi:hypothetical protein
MSALKNELAAMAAQLKQTERRLTEAEERERIMKQKYNVSYHGSCNWM